MVTWYHVLGSQQPPGSRSIPSDLAEYMLILGVVFLPIWILPECPLHFHTNLSTIASDQGTKGEPQGLTPMGPLSLPRVSHLEGPRGGMAHIRCPGCQLGEQTLKAEFLRSQMCSQPAINKQHWFSCGQKAWVQGKVGEAPVTVTLKGPHLLSVLRTLGSAGLLSLGIWEGMYSTGEAFALYTGFPKQHLPFLPATSITVPPPPALSSGSGQSFPLYR